MQASKFVISQVERRAEDKAASGTRVADRNVTLPIAHGCYELIGLSRINGASPTRKSTLAIVTRTIGVLNGSMSEASVYRILKSYDLITSPAYVVLPAADEFHDKTTRPNQLWQAETGDVLMLHG